MCFMYVPHLHLSLQTRRVMTRAVSGIEKIRQKADCLSLLITGTHTSHKRDYRVYAEVTHCDHVLQVAN